MTDLISIIVPVYNAVEYLEQCIESILKQTYGKLEIIFIDDGSTDCSGEICEHYRKMDDRVRVIHQENGGSVSARKAGLRIASGKYIGFADADDYIDADMFEKLYSTLIQYDVDFVHSGAIIDHAKKYCDTEGMVDFGALDKVEYISQNIFRSQTVSYALWSKLFKADLIKEAFMQLSDGQSYGEDLLCMCSYMIRCNKFYMLKDAFYHYRVSRESLSHLNWTNSCIQESLLYKCIADFFEKNNLWNFCKDSVDYHYKRRLIDLMTGKEENGIRILRYQIKNVKLLDGKKVALYGAGNVGKDFYAQLSQRNQCEITAWADKEKYGIRNLISIQRPEILKNMLYDVIVIAVKDKETADEIKKELIDSGICKEDSRIWWEAPSCTW